MAEEYSVQIISSGVLIRNNAGKIVQEFPTETEAWEFLRDSRESEEIGYD